MKITPIILLVSTCVLVESLSLLRPDDLGRDGVLVHYHKDEKTGKHTRHIHYRADVMKQRTQKRGNVTHNNRKLSNSVYRVRNETLLNEQHEAKLALNLRTLLVGRPKNEYISNKNNNINKTTMIVGKASTRITKKPTYKHLPSGLQFLKKQLNSRSKSDNVKTKTPVKDGADLTLDTLLGDTFIQTTPVPVENNNQVTETGLSLTDLLLDTGVSKDFSHHEHFHAGHNHEHSMSHNAGDQHVHTHNDKHGSDSRQQSPIKLFMGLFSQNQVKSKVPAVLDDTATTISPHTVPVRAMYQQSTIHARPITKRGVIESGSSYMDNILRIKINTTPPTITQRVTRATRYRGLVTPKTLQSQIEPLSGIDLVGVRKNNRKSQRVPAAVKATLDNEPVTSSEMVHLQGIHLMFSDGKLNKSDKIPTIHLTASVNNNATDTADQTAASSSQTTNYTVQNTDTNQAELATVFEKIVGTAIIRNGHLYVVIYPFGENKTLELRHNKTVQNIKLPKDNINPLSVLKKIVTLSTTRPSTTTVSPTTTEDALINLGDIIPHDILAQVNDNHGPHSHSNTPHDHHTQHDHHDHHQQHQHEQGVKLPAGDQTPSPPVPRFMSPWHSLNFSEVFAFPSKKNTSRSEEDDVDIVTFVANASDPFDKIKVVLDSLSNSSKQSGGVQEAKFNFEVKLQANALKQAMESTKQSTSNMSNENNSGEVLQVVETTTKGSSTISSVGYDTTEPLTKSTQIPSTDYSNFGSNSINEVTFKNNGAFMSEETSRKPTDMFKNKISLSTILRHRGFESVTTPTLTNTGSPDLYNSISTTPVAPVTASNVVKTYTPEKIQPQSTVSTPSSRNIVGVTKSYQPPRTTFTYFPNYTFSSISKQSNSFVNPIVSDSQGSHVGNPPSSPDTSTRLVGSQSEQLISLAEVLNDIKQLQMRHMQNLNARKYNFDTFLSETQQRSPLHAPVLVEGPVFKETSTRYSDIPMENFVTPEPLNAQRQWDQNFRTALNAMLVLSVDEILADHTSLHGALVMPHRRESSSSNNK